MKWIINFFRYKQLCRMQEGIVKSQGIHLDDKLYRELQEEIFFYQILLGLIQEEIDYEATVIEEV